MFRKRKRKGIDFEEVISDSISPFEFDLVEKPLRKGVFYITFLSSLLIAIIFGSRVLWLSGIRGEGYQERAQSNINQTIPLIAPRGIIVDRYGEPLLQNKAIFSVFLNVGQMIKNGEESMVVQAAKDVLNIPEEETIGLISHTDLDNITDVIIAGDIERDKVIEIENLGLNSLSIEQNYERLYSDAAYAHVLGYVGLVSKEDLNRQDYFVLNDTIGRSGLEMQYDDLLRGNNGKVVVSHNSQGDIAEVTRATEPVAGSSLKTTIDADLQAYFYNRMWEGLQSLGRTAGAGIALDPRNGEILALVSFPSFDANNIADYLDKPHQPLFNRAISGVYNPGSSIKPIHAVAALHEKVVDTNKSIYSAGYIEIPNPYNPELPSRFLDWKAHGWVNLYSAIARSSNVYFYEIIGGFEDQIGLGIDRLYRYWQNFGFDEKTGIDLPGEAVSTLPNPERKEDLTGDIWRIGDTYNVAIGQGDLAVTPIRLISSIAAIANGGKVFVPHLISGDEAKVSINNSYMAEDFREVRQGMQDAVSKDYGTAHMLADIPMLVSAKTGSAQIADNTKTNALFVGYAAREENADVPEIAILVLVEEAREGSLNAIPIARDILQWYYNNRVNSQSDE